MDIEVARTNMLKQQIHACNVDNDDIIAVMQQVPREAFVPKQHLNLAFADTHLPIGYGQTMLSPMEEARILNALAIQPSDNILVIGTGSGYFTALLAHFGAMVYSIDIHLELSQRAKARLQQCSITNVELITADGTNGYQQCAPYDVIVITGSLPYLPTRLRRDLRCGGRLFCIVGDAPVMAATLYTRQNETDWQHTILFETNVATLDHTIHDNAFIF